MPAAVLLALITTATSQAAVLWSEGFESPNPVGWKGGIVNSTAGAHSGSKRGTIDGPASGEFLRLEISTANVESLTLSFWFRINDGLEGSDAATLAWLDSAAVSHPLESYSDLAAGAWEARLFSLPPAAANQDHFVLVLNAAFNSASDRMSVDDFELSGVSTPEPAMAPALLALALMARLRRRGRS